MINNVKCWDKTKVLHVDELIIEFELNECFCLLFVELFEHESRNLFSLRSKTLNFR